MVVEPYVDDALVVCALMVVELVVLHCTHRVLVEDVEEVDVELAVVHSGHMVLVDEVDDVEVVLVLVPVDVEDVVDFVVVDVEDVDVP